MNLFITLVIIKLDDYMNHAHDPPWQLLVAILLKCMNHFLMSANSISPGKFEKSILRKSMKLNNFNSLLSLAVAVSPSSWLKCDKMLS